jgi:ABC-2 type transport system permease protein
MMGKLIKNELKGNYKFFLIVFATIIGACLGVLTRVGIWQPPAIFLLIFFINVSGFFVILLYQIKSFSDELYEDRGYLTFTLPVRGSSIVGAKLIIALIYLTLFFIIAGILGFQGYNVMVKLLAPYEKEQVYQIMNQIINIKMILFVFIAQILGCASFLLQVYFSVTVSKMTLKGKKVGKFIGFIIFVVLVACLTWLDFQVSKVFPQMISWDFYNTSLQFLPNDLHMIHMNIAETVLNLVVFVVLFYATSYFIEKKIDLS